MSMSEIKYTGTPLTTNNTITFTTDQWFQAVKDFENCFTKKNDVLFSIDNIDISFGPLIKSINVLVPNKVMEVEITDDYMNYPYFIPHPKSGKYKMVVQEPDQFDMRYGCALGIAKAIYGKVYTHEYLESKVPEILSMKYFAKEIDKAIKAYNKKLENAEKIAKWEEERKAIIARRKEKNKKRKAKKLEKERQAEIDMIAEAIKTSKVFENEISIKSKKNKKKKNKNIQLENDGK